MSGGSLNYLCFKYYPEICDSVSDLVKVEEFLIQEGYKDVAKDVRRLIEYIEISGNRIDVLTELLKPILHDVEWRLSCDIGDEQLEETIEKYRNGETKNENCVC